MATRSFPCVGKGLAEVSQLLKPLLFHTVTSSHTVTMSVYQEVPYDKSECQASFLKGEVDMWEFPGDLQKSELART